MHIPRQNRRDGAHPLPVPKEVDEDTHTSRHPHPRYAEPRFIEIPQALKADRTSSGSHIPLRIYVVLDTQPTVMFRTRRQDNRQQEPFFSAKPLLMKDSHSYTGAIAENHHRQYFFYADHARRFSRPCCIPTSRNRWIYSDRLNTENGVAIVATPFSSISNLLRQIVWFLIVSGDNFQTYILVMKGIVTGLIQFASCENYIFIALCELQILNQRTFPFIRNFGLFRFDIIPVRRPPIGTCTTRRGTFASDNQQFDILIHSIFTQQLIREKMVTVARMLAGIVNKRFVETLVTNDRFRLPFILSRNNGEEYQHEDQQFFHGT